MSYDIPSISELESIQLLNKHYAEVITSKKDGIASGLDITQTTNPITSVVRRTLYKILDDMDDTFLERLLKMAFTPVGTFTAGATLTDARQTLLWEVSQGGDGHYYSWSGTFPKAVAAGSAPSPIEAGSWVDRTDDSLRDEIRETVFQNMKRSYAEAGFNLVDGSFQMGGSLSGWPDVLWDWATGKGYQWYLDEAKTIPSGSTPATSGGIGAGAWVDRSDVTLRDTIGDVYLSDYCTGNGVDSDVAGFRLAVAACAPGKTIHGDSWATYYLDWQTDGKIVEIKKGIKIDFHGASVVFKPYSDLDKAGTHAPAIRFTTDSTGLIYTFSGSINEGAKEINLGAPHSLSVGDWVEISSDQLYTPWNYPNNREVTTFTGVGELSQVRYVNGNTIGLERLISRTYSGNITVSKKNMITGIEVCNISSVQEVDANIASTKTLWSDCGHFISIEKAIAPCVHNIYADKGWRLFLCWFATCINAHAHHIFGKVTNTLYPAYGGHAYLIRHNGSIGAFSYNNIGAGVRHVIDYTNSLDCLQQNNLGFGTRGGAFTTHGFYENNIKSIGDTVSNDDFVVSPSTTDYSFGWVVGNETFNKTSNVTIREFTFTGKGNPISITSLSENILIDNPKIDYYGESYPFLIKSGAKNVSVKGGYIKCHSVTNTRPLLFSGCPNPYDFGSATYSASAGTDPAITLVSANSTPFVVGDSVYLCLNDTANGEYSGLWNVTNFVSSTKTYTLKSANSRTTTTALNFTDTWDPVIGRRAHFSSELKSPSNITISGTEFYHAGQPSSASLVFNADDDIVVHNIKVSASNNASDLILIDSRVGNGECGHVSVVGVGTTGDSKFSSFIQVNTVDVKSGTLVDSNVCRNFYSHALRIRGTPSSIRDHVLTNGLKMVNNDFKAPSCVAATSFNVWAEMQLGYDVCVANNSYPTSMSDATYGLNWERGSGTLTVGTTSGGSATAYTYQTYKYSLSGKTLNINLRAAWSGLSGSNMQIKMSTAMPSVQFNIPCAVSGVTLSSLVGILSPNYSGAGTINLRQTSTSGVDSWVPLAASGDLCASLSISM